jgi:flagellar biosynthesis regulator FlaF
MSGYREINKAYQSAINLRSQRDQEADVFDIARSKLRDGLETGSLPLSKALADNTRLWQTVVTLTLDPNNPQPTHIRQSLLSLATAVTREMQRPKPNVNFLIEVNGNIAAGLRGIPPTSD